MDSSKTLPADNISPHGVTDAESRSGLANHNQSAPPPGNEQKPSTDDLASSYAIGYREALALRFSGRQAKFFAQAFAGEHDIATANSIGKGEAISYATDFAGPYALAVMAFLKENSEIVSAAKLIPEAQEYAYSHLASYETGFRDIQHAVLNDEADKEQRRQEQEALVEKQRLEEVFALEKRIKQERKDAKDEGYREGYAEGNNNGKQEGHKKGHQEGFAKGHKEGSSDGYNMAISKDYDEGLQLGKRDAYKKSALLVAPFLLAAAIYSYFLA